MKRTPISDTALLSSCNIYWHSPDSLIKIWDTTGKEESEDKLLLLTNYFVSNNRIKAAKHAMNNAPLSLFSKSNFELISTIVDCNQIELLPILVSRGIDFKSLPKNTFDSCNTKYHADMAGYLIQEAGVKLSTHPALVPSYIEFKGGSVTDVLNSVSEDDREAILPFLGKTSLRISEYDPDYDYENPLIK